MMATKKMFEWSPKTFQEWSKNLAVAWLVNFTQIGNQSFWIVWFGDWIVLGNDQTFFISKLMVEIEPSLMEQLIFFEQLKNFLAMTEIFSSDD